MSTKTVLEAAFAALVIGLLGFFLTYPYAGPVEVGDTLEQDSPDYYGTLRASCSGKENRACCESSVQSMESSGGFLAEQGTCPVGYERTMLRCIDSYQWCRFAQDANTDGVDMSHVIESDICSSYDLSVADDALSCLADRLEQGDVEGALTFFSSSPDNRDVLESLNATEQTRLAKSFRNAVLVKEVENVRVYTGTFFDVGDGTEHQNTRFSFTKRPAGNWIILSW